MVRLIDDLLDLSRVTRGRIQLEKERVDLWSILGTALEASRPMLESAGVELSIRLPETPCVLDADRTRLAQVLSNLLNNAANVTPRGGRVEVTALLADADVLIRVTDTGIGIPPHMLTHIFGMFAQVGDSRTQSGLGIGLTLVRSLVELHGGKVWAESRGPGTGSSFVIRLPHAQRVAGTYEPPADTLPASPSRSSRRIMVVDDNVDAAAMLAALLQLHGHDVRTAASAPEALATGEEFNPEIVFLDIGLPGMSGYELARRLRDRPDMRSATLVAVTGWGQEDDRRQSKEAGIDHHLTKPVDSAHVLAVVADVAHHH
jgi:CheY-like chemotaxis protein